MLHAAQLVPPLFGLIGQHDRDIHRTTQTTKHTHHMHYTQHTDRAHCRPGVCYGHRAMDLWRHRWGPVSSYTHNTQTHTQPYCTYASQSIPKSMHTFIIRSAVQFISPSAVTRCTTQTCTPSYPSLVPPLPQALLFAPTNNAYPVRTQAACCLH